MRYQQVLFRRDAVPAAYEGQTRPGLRVLAKVLGVMAGYAAGYMAVGVGLIKHDNLVRSTIEIGVGVGLLLGTNKMVQWADNLCRPSNAAANDGPAV